MKKLNAIINDLSNFVNSAVNKQALQFVVKKNGHWQKADGLDMLFFKSEHMPRRRGDLLQTNTWNGHLLAVFISNENGKDVHYVKRQLREAEEMAPQWVLDNSAGIEVA